MSDDEIHRAVDQLVNMWRARNQAEGTPRWGEMEDNCIKQVQRIKQLYIKHGHKPMEDADLTALYNTRV